MLPRAVVNQLIVFAVWGLIAAIFLLIYHLEYDFTGMVLCITSNALGYWWKYNKHRTSVHISELSCQSHWTGQNNQNKTKKNNQPERKLETNIASNIWFHCASRFQGPCVSCTRCFPFNPSQRVLAHSTQTLPPPTHSSNLCMLE